MAAAAGRYPDRLFPLLRLKVVDDAGLSQSEREQILWKTATRLFRLGEAALSPGADGALRGSSWPPPTITLRAFEPALREDEVWPALVVAPSTRFTVWQGMKSLDPGLSEMAPAFSAPRWTISRRVLLPQTIPFLFAAARLSLALTWKIIIFVELLGRSSGVGYRIEHWYQLFNMKRVLASALLFVPVMLIIELAVMRNLERFLFRWRPEEAR